MSDVAKVVVAVLAIVGLLVSALLGACGWYLKELRDEYVLTRSEITGLREDIFAARDQLKTTEAALEAYLKRNASGVSNGG